MSGRATTAGELWLLCPGDDDALAASLAAFAHALPARVQAHAEPACARWAAAFARAAGCTAELLAHEADTLAAARESHAAQLVLLPAEAVRASVARALELPPRGARALRIDPGRAFLLRRDAHGFLLRHANVLGPELDPGTPLPSGRRAP